MKRRGKNSVRNGGRTRARALKIKKKNRAHGWPTGWHLNYFHNLKNPINSREHEWKRETKNAKSLKSDHQENFRMFSISFPSKKNLQHWDDGAASNESKKSDILWGGQDQAKRVEARKNEDWNTVAKCEKIRVKCGTRKRVWISFFVSFYITGYLQITSSAPSSLKTHDSKSQILVRSSSLCSAHCCEWIMSRRRKVKISVRIRRSWTLHDNDDVITSKSAAWRARLDVTTAHTMSCLRRTIRGKERKKKKREEEEVSQTKTIFTFSILAFSTH